MLIPKVTPVKAENIQNLISLITTSGAITTDGTTATGSAVECIVTLNGNIVTVQPSELLTAGQEYTIEIAAGITDLAGNALIIPSLDKRTFIAGETDVAIYIQNTDGNDISSLTLNVNETVKIAAKSVPNKSLSWLSEDTSVAAVTANNDGTAVIKALKEGKTKVNVATSDNKYSKSIDIVVNNIIADPENAPKFETEFPFVDLDEEGNIKINIKTLTDADVYIVQGYGDENTPASATDVLHGHRANQWRGDSYLVYAKANTPLVISTYRKLVAGMPSYQYFIVATVKGDTSIATNVKTLNINNDLQSAMDTEGPVFDNAYINADRTKVTLLSREALDKSSVPDVSAFTADGLAPDHVEFKTFERTYGNFTDILASGIILSFDSPLAGSEKVNVSYVEPTLNPIQDTSLNKNKADNFTIQTKTPGLGIADALYNANTGEMDILFNNYFDVWSEADWKELQKSLVLNAGDTPIAIKDIFTTSYYYNSGYIALKINCEALSDLADGSELTLTYNKPATGGMKNNAGDEVESFNQKVIVSKTGPALQSAAYNDYSSPVEGNYDIITGAVELAFDKAISQSDVANCSFTIKVDGTPIPSTLTRVSVPWMYDYANGNGNKVTIYIHDPYLTITKSSVITITYAPLHEGNADTIKDACGNAVTMAITNAPVTNNSYLD